jgi:hypothetical protein
LPLIGWLVVGGVRDASLLAGSGIGSCIHQPKKHRRTGGISPLGGARRSRAGGRRLREEVQVVFLVVDRGGEDLVVLDDLGPERLEALERIGTGARQLRAFDQPRKALSIAQKPRGCVILVTSSSSASTKGNPAA